jgi:hypothetical protein
MDTMHSVSGMQYAQERIANARLLHRPVVANAARPWR